MAEQRKSGAEITDQQSGEQHSHARAQRNGDAANGKGRENADQSTQEDRRAEHDEIDTRTRPNGGTDFCGCRPYQRIRADDAQNVATLQRDIGCDGNLLLTAPDRPQVHPARPFLRRDIAKPGIREIRID